MALNCKLDLGKLEYIPIEVETNLGKRVIFKDPEIEKVIRKQIKKPEGYIFEYDVRNIIDNDYKY